MVAVERVQEYSKLQPEPDVGNDENLPKHWPCKGSITASKVSFKYHNSLPPALDGIDFSIQENENVCFQDLLYFPLVYQSFCNGL